MAPPLAYFLSWTCYGQRLPGDARGWVDRQHNKRGTPLREPDPELERAMRERMTGPAVWLSDPMREVVDAAIVALCDQRNWLLLARAVRSTHAHVVVNCAARCSPDAAMEEFKDRGRWALARVGMVEAGAKLWTVHGSTRWINHHAGLYAAIAYVNEWQSGPKRRMLEEHRRRTREQIVALKAWLKSQGLPEDGKGVVAGETAEERAKRLRPWTAGDGRVSRDTTVPAQGSPSARHRDGSPSQAH